MPSGPTDFYLNLDRWEALSTIERDRGRWEARIQGPPARLDAVRREAILEASLAQVGPVAPDSKLKDLLLAPAAPEQGGEPLLRAWRYGRAVQFVHGWYEAFRWTDAGFVQLIRLLDRTGSTDPSRIIAVRLQAALIGRQGANVPMFEIGAFLGGASADLLDHGADIQLYWLALRLLILQKGYLQVQFAPIETLWQRPGSAAPHPAPDPEDPDERLGAWLDEAARLLAEAGRWAEQAWERTRAAGPRSSLQEAILGIAEREGRVTAGDVLRATGANRNTVKDNLSRLVAEGVLHKKGSKRGTIYTPA